MKRKLTSIIAAAFVTTHLTAFDFTTLIPALTGALTGAGCYALFKDNRAMATALCAAGGAWVGFQLRNYLKEQEQAELMKATYKTLDTGKTETVTTEEGNTITTELVKPSPENDSKSKRDAKRRTPGKPSDQQVASAEEGDCGTVRQTVITKDNQRIEDTVNACKKEGTWVVG